MLFLFLVSEESVLLVNEVNQIPTVSGITPLTIKELLASVINNAVLFLHSDVMDSPHMLEMLECTSSIQRVLNKACSILLDMSGRGYSEMTDIIWREISVSPEELSLANILPTGQAFRWHKTGSDPEEWSGTISRRVYSLQQTNNALLFHVHNQTVAKDDHEYDDVTILKNYFQLDISCTELFTEWSKNDKIFKESCHHCQGIRILSQDPIETMYAFICSSNNNIPRISLMMNRLCRHFGTLLGFYRDREFYDIPTFESLTVTGAEETLRELGFGYRAKYITNAAKYILEHHTKEWLYSLCQVDYEEAWQLLQTVPGVGPKVADCICLMGLGKSQAVPVDTHIWRVAIKQYGLKVAASKTLTLTVYKQIGDMFRSRHGIYAGWAQAILFRRELLRDKEKKN